MAAAAGAVRHHRRHALLQPEAPRQRHDQGLPFLLRCFLPTSCVHLAVFRAAQRQFACHTWGGARALWLRQASSDPTVVSQTFPTLQGRATGRWRWRRRG